MRDIKRDQMCDQMCDQMRDQKRDQKRDQMRDIWDQKHQHGEAFLSKKKFKKIT